MKKYSIDKEVTIYYDIDFDERIFDLELGEHSINWPVTYILYNRSERKAYVGETTNFKNRMVQHLEDDSKNTVYNKALFIDYKYATKSTILYLEAFLIRGLSISHELLNELSNIKSNSNKHDYYNQAHDQKMCETVWNALKNDVGIVKQEYKDIVKKNEFKYSPYIALNDNQNTILNNIIDELCTKDRNMIVVEGASGTGKSAVGIQLLKRITDYSNFDGTIDDSMVGENIDRVLKMKEVFGKKYYSVAYVVPINNFCTIIRKSISRIKGLKKADLKKNRNYINEHDLECVRVYSGGDLYKNLSSLVKNGEPVFDLMIVDEAQRLNRRYNLTWQNYANFDKMNKILGLPCNKNKDDGNQLDWILKLSKNQVFLYDKRQSIKSSDIPSEYFDKVFKNKTYAAELVIEERCLGGHKYINYIDSIFSNKPPKERKTFDDYEFTMYDNYSDMVNALKLKEDNLSLKASGYFFANEENDCDIIIDGQKQKWNQVNANWVNNPKRKDDEIGCIHVLEGVDVDYLGIIVGSEIDYKNNKLVVDKDKYKDVIGKRSIDNDDQLVQFITNIYYVLLTRAMKGTYLYVVNPEMKKYLERYINKK